MRRSIGPQLCRDLAPVPLALAMNHGRPANFRSSSFGLPVSEKSPNSFSGNPVVTHQSARLLMSFGEFVEVL